MALVIVVCALAGCGNGQPDNGELPHSAATRLRQDRSKAVTSPPDVAAPPNSSDVPQVAQGDSVPSSTASRTDSQLPPPQDSGQHFQIGAYFYHHNYSMDELVQLAMSAALDIIKFPKDGSTDPSQVTMWIGNQDSNFGTLLHARVHIHFATPNTSFSLPNQPSQDLTLYFQQSGGAIDADHDHPDSQGRFPEFKWQKATNLDDPRNSDPRLSDWRASATQVYPR